jgi:S1-C subfamily serine protease
MSSQTSKRATILVGAMLLIIFGFVLGTAVIHTSANAATFISQPSAIVQAASPATESERYFSQIYNQVSPSVVSINVDGVSDQLGQFQASGTGFVIDKAGHIVTNNHVVDGAQNIEVNFLDGTIVRGNIVAVDPDSDLAVISVDMPQDRLTPITFGDSSSLFVGQTTLAIGSPFGERWTLTTGIISALDRTIQGLTDFSVGSVIQTDAAINPGNSGGPLLNLKGEVIGVNSQILSQNRSSSGVGFAIPSNLVKRVADELISNGKVNYSLLGISSTQDEGITLNLIEQYNLPNNLRGVVIGGVQQGGPAQQAGLRGASNQSLDIITAIDSIPVTNMSALVSYLAINTKPGQTVNLTVWRSGQQISLPVVLGSR